MLKMCGLCVEEQMGKWRPGMCVGNRKNGEEGEGVRLIFLLWNSMDLVFLLEENGGISFFDGFVREI